MSQSSTPTTAMMMTTVTNGICYSKSSAETDRKLEEMTDRLLVRHRPVCLRRITGAISFRAGAPLWAPLLARELHVGPVLRAV
jgi:hypothetical protein